MDLFLDPRAAFGSKWKQIEEARKMQQAVIDRAERTGVAVPPYEFLELIGKGAFGRVFKCKRSNSPELVAVKIIDVDKSDLKLEQSQMNGAINDIVNEIKVLQQLKDSNARNINIIHETVPLHSQLWIVSEYCPGGSVHTLMKANPHPGLEEEFIIPIARELAVALKFVHEAGIIHRDIKAANVLITEDGRLQLCDFGVAGVLESAVSKRTTIIGTPNWMPPEMQPTEYEPFDLDSQLKYGTEIDCWAFGCTVYEMATGLPPNARVHPSRLGDVLKREVPRLEDDRYPKALQEFVAFCLEPYPEKRPDAEAILQHSYIQDSSRKYPTGSLSKLLVRYAYWEQSGGQRASLFNPYGAAGPATLDPSDLEEDAWNFSTTDEFHKRVSRLLLDPDPSIDEYDALSAADDPPTQGLGASQNLAPFHLAENERRVAKGERSMARIFDREREPYELTNSGEPAEEELPPMSDLPFRNMVIDDSADRSTMIDLDTAELGQEISLDLGEMPTLRASKFYKFDEYEDQAYDGEAEYDEQKSQYTRRATRDWKFPTSDETPEESRKRRTREWASATRQHLADTDEDVMDLTRRTQDWSFPLVEPQASSLSDEGPGLPHPPKSTSSLLGFRPKLKHTVTEPLGNFGDYLHPTSSSTADSPVEPPPTKPLNPSVILPVPVHQHRSSTPGSSYSSCYTDSINRDPFEFEKVLHASEGRRTSFHTHTQSEPPHVGSGMLTPSEYSIGGSHHTRGNSLNSQSSLERTSRVPLSDEEEARRASEFWDQHNDEQFATLRTTAPMLTVGSGFQGGAWEKYVLHQTSAQDMDSFGEPGDIVTANTDAFDQSVNNLHTTRSLVEASNHALPPSRSRATTVSSQITTSTIPDNVVDWPDAQLPHPDVFIDNADPDLMLSETIRIFETFRQHLVIARSVLCGGLDDEEEDGPEAGSGKGFTREANRRNRPGDAPLEAQGASKAIAAAPTSGPVSRVTLEEPQSSRVRLGAVKTETSASTSRTDGQEHPYRNKSYHDNDDDDAVTSLTAFTKSTKAHTISTTATENGRKRPSSFTHPARDRKSPYNPFARREQSPDTATLALPTDSLALPNAKATNVSSTLPAPNGEVKKLQAENKDLKATVDKLQVQLTDAINQLHTLKAQVKESESARLSRLREEGESIERALDHLKATGEWLLADMDEHTGRHMEVIRGQDEFGIPFATGHDERFEQGGTIHRAIEARVAELDRARTRPGNVPNGPTDHVSKHASDPDYEFRLLDYGR